MFDVFCLLVLIVFVLCPLFSEVDIFGFRIKKDIEKVRDEITQHIAQLQSEIRTSIEVNIDTGKKDIHELDGVEEQQATARRPSYKEVEQKAIV